MRYLILLLSINIISSYAQAQEEVIESHFDSIYEYYNTINAHNYMLKKKIDLQIKTFEIASGKKPLELNEIYQKSKRQNVNYVNVNPPKEYKAEDTLPFYSGIGIEPYFREKYQNILNQLSFHDSILHLEMWKDVLIIQTHMKNEFEYSNNIILYLNRFEEKKVWKKFMKHIKRKKDFQIDNLEEYIFRFKPKMPRKKNKR